MTPEHELEYQLDIQQEEATTPQNPYRKEPIHMAMNRSERRAAERTVKRNKNFQKTAAVGLATLLIGGIAAPAQAAFKDDAAGITMTAGERAAISQTQSGTLKGSIKATVDADELAAFERVVGDVDIENSTKITNAQMDGNFWLDIKFDSKKNKAALARYGMDHTDEDDSSSYVSIATLNNDQRHVYGNMATAKTWNKPTFKPGDPLAVLGGSSNYPNSMETHLDTQGFYDESLGAVAIGQTLPIVDVINGGATNKATSEDETTTVTDPYSDSLTNKAYMEGIASKNVRGLSQDSDNCLIDKCSIWITAVGNSTTQGQKALAVLQIDIESTVSAGKSPDFKEHTLASGDKYKFSPTNTVRGSWGEWKSDYFNLKNIAEYQFASKLAKDILKVNDTSKVDISSLNFQNGNVDISANSNQNVSFGYEALPKKVVITGSTDRPVENWTFNGDKLSMGSKFESGYGKGLTPFNLKVTSLTDTSITLEATNDDYKQADIKSLDSVTLGASLEFYSGSATAAGTPEVKLQFEKSMKPVEPKPEPTPEPTPEPKPEPKPVSPVAKPDFKAGKQGETLNIKVMVNDKASKGATVIKGSVRAVDSKTGARVENYKIAGAGTYVALADNTMNFVPVAKFSGKAKAITYSWQQRLPDGTIETVSSTVQAEIAPAPVTPKPEPKPEPEKPAVPTPSTPDVPKTPEKPATPDVPTDTTVLPPLDEEPPTTTEITDEPHGDSGGSSEKVDLSSIEVTDTGSALALVPYASGGLAGLFAMLFGFMRFRRNKVESTN